MFIWEIAVGDLACQRQICKAMSKRPNILNASFCDQEEEFQKMSSIENKWLGLGIGFHMDAITDLSSLELIRFFTDPLSPKMLFMGNYPMRKLH